jgi:gas vesicle protein
MPGIGTAIGAGVGAVVGVISGLFKSKKMKKEARTLTGEQDRMFASASAKRRAGLAGRDASLALSIPTRKHSGS